MPEIYIRGLALTPDGRILSTSLTRAVIARLQTQRGWVILLDPVSEREAEIQEAYRSDISRRPSGGSAGRTA